jgi:hypothetical protein
MAYYIFLKSLRSLEEFRKNPHAKIPPKSPSTNFKSLGKFKNPIFNSEILFPCFRPGQPCGTLGLWPSQLPLAFPLLQAEAHRPAQAAQPTRAVGIITEVRFLLGFTSSALYPSLTWGTLLSALSSPPRRQTPAVKPPRRRSPRRRLRASDAVKPLPPPSSFPPLIPFKPSLNEP